MKKKRILLILLALVMTFSVVGCSKGKDVVEDEQVENSEKEKDDSKKDGEVVEEGSVKHTNKTEEQADIGKGKVYLENDDGETTEDEKIVSVKIGESDSYLILLEAFDIEVEEVTVSLDGQEWERMFLEDTGNVIEITGEHLNEGIHSMEIEGEDFYRFMQYEVK